MTMPGVRHMISADQIITRLRAADITRDDTVPTITAHFTVIERDEIVRLLTIARDSQAQGLDTLLELQKGWTREQKTLATKVSLACDGHSYDDVLGILVVMASFTLQARFGPASTALALAIDEFTDNVIDLIAECPQPLDSEGVFHG